MQLTVTVDDLYLHGGQQLKQVIPSPVRERIDSLLGQFLVKPVE